MISLSLARSLKDAGLPWQPQQHDRFMIPDRDMDDVVFSVSHMAITIGTIQGFPMINFQGAYEWALDYIWLQEVVWIPTEGQLREEIERRVESKSGPSLRLTRTPGGYVCELQHRDAYLTFVGKDAGTAYAQALLELLQNASDPRAS